MSLFSGGADGFTAGASLGVSIVSLTGASTAKGAPETTALYYTLKVHFVGDHLSPVLALVIAHS